MKDSQMIQSDNSAKSAWDPEQYAKFGFTLNVKIDGPKIINLNIRTSH